jgi:hypothetical protein
MMISDIFMQLTLPITGSKKQSNEGVPLFAVRVDMLVMF